MIHSKWVNPVIAGSCTPKNCGAACCKDRIYTDATTYTEAYCPHLDQTEMTCTIYEDRWEGCRRYPQVESFTMFQNHDGCGYYVAEADD